MLRGLRATAEPAADYLFPDDAERHGKGKSSDITTAMTALYEHADEGQKAKAIVKLPAMKFEFEEPAGGTATEVERARFRKPAARV